MARISALDGRPVRELVEEPAAAHATRRDRQPPRAGAQERSRRRPRARGPQPLGAHPRAAPDLARAAAGRQPDRRRRRSGAIRTRAEVSVEEEFARDLGLGVGSKIVFDVQGVPVELAVTSLRRVRWESFGINFFLVVEPGVARPGAAAADRRGAPAGGRRGRSSRTRSPPRTRTSRSSRSARCSRRWWRCSSGSGSASASSAASPSPPAPRSSPARSRRAPRAAAAKSRSRRALGMTRGQVAALFAVEYGARRSRRRRDRRRRGHGARVRRCSSAAWRCRGALELRPARSSPSSRPPLVAVVAGLAASAGALARRPIEALRHE